MALLQWEEMHGAPCAHGELSWGAQADGHLSCWLMRVPAHSRKGRRGAVPGRHRCRVTVRRGPHPAQEEPCGRPGAPNRLQPCPPYAASPAAGRCTW